MAASPASLLRYVRRTATAPHQAPKIIGVDDFTRRRGQSYATMVVDLEKHRPIDLLPDRSAPTLAALLKANPGIRIIGRDRSTEYARGIAEDAPTAVEVLDRWHLLKTLREALERMLDRNQQVLGEIALPSSARANGARAFPTSDYAPTPRSPSEQAARRARRRRRHARHDEVHKLHSRGMSMRAIAQKLDLSRWAVRRYVNADTFPERRPHQRRSSMLDPFEPYLSWR